MKRTKEVPKKIVVGMTRMAAHPAPVWLRACVVAFVPFVFRGTR